MPGNFDTKKSIQKTSEFKIPACFSATKMKFRHFTYGARMEYDLVIQQKQKGKYPIAE